MQGNQYSIKDLERLSGIKAHTIRIWEQRYGIIQPQRTATNIRYYTDVDLKRILNISLLNNNSYKISRIAGMSDDELHREVVAVTNIDPALTNQINALTIAMVELDEVQFEYILAANILRHGFEKTMINVIFPFMEKIGVMWLTGAVYPMQEHFITNMIRQKLIVAIDAQGASVPNDTTSYLLFCPEGEYHEIGLLFANYLLRVRRKKVIYLGANVPIADLAAVKLTHQPNYLFTFITTTPAGAEIKTYLQHISQLYTDTPIWVAGAQFKNISHAMPNSVTVMLNAYDLVAHIEGQNISMAS